MRHLKVLHISFLLKSALLFVFAAVIPAHAQNGDITFVHDPCIVKCGDAYYIFSTGDRLAVRRSHDLVKWEAIGSVFNAIPGWGKTKVPGVTNIWAPDIFYHKGTYYLYYSLSTFGSNRSCIGLATNVTLDPDAPGYAWADQGQVFQSNPDKDNFNAIDPNIVMDDAGKIWMSFGSFWGGIKLIELDSTTWKPKSDRLYAIASRSGVNAIEAPFIIRKNGYYYLFVSFDYCCRGAESTYKIMLGRSDRITGPYQDKFGRSMLAGGGHCVLSGSDRWRGPGHCAVLLEGDSSWLVHHAYDAENNGVATLRIRPLSWDKEGWPSAEEFDGVQQHDASGDAMGYALYQNFPNPFNSSTTIRYFIEKKSWVCIKIYDLLGNEIETLVNNKVEPGEYKIFWSPDDLASGVYACRLKVDKFHQMKKLIYLK